MPRSVEQGAYRVAGNGPDDVILCQPRHGAEAKGSQPASPSNRDTELSKKPGQVHVVTLR